MNGLFQRGVGRIAVVGARTMMARRPTSTITRPFSAVATVPDEYSSSKHCQTCTCESEHGFVTYDDGSAVLDSTQDAENSSTTQPHPSHPCGQQDVIDEELPPPLPEPTYSVHKRVMPDNLIALNSPDGRRMLLDALSNNTAESYWSLMEHFTNQSDPAYCGITTLLIVLNSLSVDPNIRWRGGWRYYGDEDTLLERCCFSRERIQRAGINLQEFARLGKCQGLTVSMKQPTDYTEDDFRDDVRQVLSSSEGDGILVASFSRSALGQTGEGHFSPIAAYHEETDCVLVLDVARFKYPPYWVSISELFDAMKPLDEATQKPRGWSVLRPPPISVRNQAAVGEARRPAHLVPQAKESDICPVGTVKVTYCEAAPTKPSVATKR